MVSGIFSFQFWDILTISHLIFFKYECVTQRYKCFVMCEKSTSKGTDSLLLSWQKDLYFIYLSSLYQCNSNIEHPTILIFKEQKVDLITLARINEIYICYLLKINLLFWGFFLLCVT